MIFENYLTEQEKIENFIKEAGEEKGFIFKVYYDEENKKVVLNNLYRDNNNIIHEANIDQKKLHMKKYNKRAESRYIMITGSSNAKHPGRMKVSKPGIKINSNNHINYISIYRKDKDTICCDGSIKNIDMSKDEYNNYVNLFIRNENIIQLARSNNGKYDKYLDNAFINDEKYRANGYIVDRDISGNVKIYDKNGNIIKDEMIGDE